MYEIVDLIMRYKQDESDESLKKILALLIPYINTKANRVPSFYKEDIIQELMLGTISVIKHLNFLATPLDDYFFQKDNLNFLVLHNFSFAAIADLVPNPYFLSFLKERGIEILKDAFLTQNFSSLQNSFWKFTIRNQFFHILEKKYSSILSNFYRKYTRSIALESHSLNIRNKKGVERVDELPSSYSTPSIDLEKYGILKEDVGFLMLFWDGSSILTQEKVSKLLGTSQQNISKKIVALRKKYQGKL